jgi:peptidyl-prolyl cis-trans isomerase D
MAVLSKIRQRSALMIAVIAFALFAFIIGDLFKSGSFDSTSKDVGSINGKIFHLRILELKVMLKKKWCSSTAAAIEFGIKRFQ